MSIVRKVAFAVSFVAFIGIESAPNSRRSCRGRQQRGKCASCNGAAAGDVEYQKSGSNYYRTAFQGSNLVYVTAQP
jgi:hypothetical protein